MKKKLGVIGVGSAGVLSLIHFCTWLDNGWDVVAIHNPAKKILGIGESTNGGFVGLLERGLRFCLGDKNDMDAMDATIKYGSRFSQWREHGWVNPLLDGNTAIHFNNLKFKEFAFARLPKLWPEKFKVIEGDVKAVKNYPDHVGVVIDEMEHQFDYVMDCMGFPPNFDGYHVSDCSPVNRCVVHSLPVGDFEYEPWTDHIAHEHGWMFGVPLQNRKTFGYLFNDTITEKAVAQKDMLRILGVKAQDGLEIKSEFLFKNYFVNQMIEGRVGKNGNKALFFEPLIANSIFLYIYTVRLFYDFIMGDINRERCNMMFTKAVNEMEDVITYYYQGGSIFKSPFWDFAEPAARERLRGRRDFTEVMKLYGDLKSRGILHHGPTYAFVPLTWEIVDEQMGYSYVDRAVPAAVPV